MRLSKREKARRLRGRERGDKDDGKGREGKGE